MIFADARCEDCNHIFEIKKENTMDDFILGDCPKCGSENVKRIFSFLGFSTAQGLCGNQKNGYEKSFTYHPNSMIGRSKGVRYSSTNKNNK